MKNIFFILLSLFLLTACDKEVNLDLPDQSGKIIIEGNVTDTPGPYTVRITKSIAFNHNNQYPPIEDAKVVLSDNEGQSETLEYIGAGEYQTTNFKGITSRTYTLKVQVNGKQYIAQSTMPKAIPFKGVAQDSFSIGGETSYTILPLFTDPIALGNRYLFSITANNKPKKTLQVLSDNVNNGLPNQVPILLPNTGDDKIVKGDSLHVEMQCIDDNTFNYYSALIQISDGGPGGVTPSNPPSNISNGALGYFSAHTVKKRHIVIKKP